MFKLAEKEFANREEARTFRRNVHAKNPAQQLKAPEKNSNGKWVIPGLKHNKTLVWTGRKVKRDENGKIIVNV